MPEMPNAPLFPSTAQPCIPKWEQGIYQLEYTDPARGYNPVTGSDGKANIQWTQLGNRTLFLRQFLESEHSATGHHQLRDLDFVTGTQIPESSLQLKYPTKALHDTIQEQQATVAEYRERSDTLANISLSFSGAMAKLVPLAREYSDTQCDYELFDSNISMREFNNTRITREIAGDDSLDVVSTTGIKVGETYILCDLDGSQIEEATVMSVLSEHRIRFTEALGKTRLDGYLASTTLIQDASGAIAYGDFIYMSDWTSRLVNSRTGKLFLHRDHGNVTRKVEYQTIGSGSWQVAPLIDTVQYADTTVDDVYSLPPYRLRFRITYTNGNYPYHVYYLVVKPVHDIIWIETIRQPVLVSATLDRMGALAVAGNQYASLYDIAQQGMEVFVSVQGQFAVESQIYGKKGKVSSMSATLPMALVAAAPLNVRIRYSDAEGAISRWSQPVTLGLPE